ncbi:MAG: NUDIX hydrolase [bacterium]
MALPKCPLLTVDVVIVVEGKVVLVTRGKPPFEGMRALPGGFVDVGETVEDAAAREALEETSLRVRIVDLVGVFSDPRRDPRGHAVSIAFLAAPESGVLRGADDALDAALFSQGSLPPLAFDHEAILKKAFPLARRHGLLDG